MFRSVTRGGWRDALWTAGAFGSLVLSRGDAVSIDGGVLGKERVLDGGLLA